MNKRGFEFSFAWIFAVIVGAIILFLAIYGVSKLIGTGRYQIDTVTAKELSIIFEPMEVGLASGKSSIANLREDTRIYNDCYSSGNFGKHRISLATKSGLGGKWKEPGGEISVPNKYIFSQDVEQGKTVYFFSKPFEMPWKVSEIIFLTTGKYCFVNAPEEIEDEVLGLNLQNIKVNNCSSGDMRVCFDTDSDCDAMVRGGCNGILECESDYDYGVVEKNGESMFYAGSLMYGAIFSSKEIYECNVKRLMNRLRQQALLFKDEADFLTGKCGVLSSAGLIQLANAANSLKESGDLLLIYNQGKQVDDENEAAECKLW